MKRTADVVVIGGGVIGSSVAYYAAKRGLSVALVDAPRRGRATSASAGGLWPMGESVGLGCGVIFFKTMAGKDKVPAGTHGPGQLPKCFLDFALHSNAMFPELAEELRTASGIDIEWERTSLLFLMYDEGDVAFAKPLHDACPSGRNLTEWLTPQELRKEEPAVTPTNLGALRFHGDDQVNPYRLADAFRRAAKNLGADVLSHTAARRVESRQDRVVSVETDAGPIACQTVVNAAGAWAAEVGQMVGLDIPVRPVRGQIIGTEALPKTLSACLSTTDCYLAQKKHGEIVIGSTTEEVGFDVRVTSTALASLAAGAIRAVPFLNKVRIKRTWSGLRPGSPDELPFLGPVEGLSGYLNACGHFRTGILMSPITGLVTAELASHAQPSYPIEPFLMARLESVPSGG